LSQGWIAFYDNKHAYACQLNSFTHLRGLTGKQLLTAAVMEYQKVSSLRNTIQLTGKIMINNNNETGAMVT
jgi:transglutaminase/protease-like cytokinesis protein 3